MNFADTLQHALQAQINAAVAGYDSRLTRLEAKLAEVSKLVELNTQLELRNAELERQNAKLEACIVQHSNCMTRHGNCIATQGVRIAALEKAYPEMSTTKDLLKMTDPAFLTDRMHLFIERVVKSLLEGYVKESDVEAAVEAFLANPAQGGVEVVSQAGVLSAGAVPGTATLPDAQLRIDADKLDAQRYRWLRVQHWSDNVVSVVRHPRDTVKLNVVCYSEGELDNLIDRLMMASDPASKAVSLDRCADEPPGAPVFGPPEILTIRWTDA